jgi:CheY-like chemotaxis protein/anti-sigma regulatory factor (Ser/Thr protein kinase)
LKENPKILVVDDLAANRLLLRGQLKQMGFERVILAENGAQGVEAFKTEQPDVVLMDVVMPVMDGYEAAYHIKVLAGQRWVPILFITGSDSQQQQIRCLEVGEDFLARPVHFVILKAKIEAILRTIRLHEQIQQKTQELEQYYHNAEEEKRFTAHLMRNMVEGPGLRDPSVLSIIFPAEHHSGDLIMAARAPNQSLFVMLADGTGHGLAAAINVLPLPQIFYAMVAKGFALPSLARELNAKAHGWLPRDRFVAATLIEINEREQSIKVWNGGNPDVLLMDERGCLKHTWKSRHLPLGVLAEPDFESHYEAAYIDRPGQLFVVSDGLLEATSVTGEHFGMERLINTLTIGKPHERFQAVVDNMSAHLGNRQAHDDVSMLMVDVGLTPSAPVIASSGKNARISEGENDGWKLQMELGMPELRYYDVAPHVLSLLEKLNDVRQHKTSLFLLLSELLVNAIDHGLLKLDSSIKQQPEGFERYLALREERLAALVHGVVSVGIEKAVDNGHRVMKITVSDSGEGFDFKSLELHLDSNHAPYGRGLALVKSLSSRLEFRRNGSEVVVHYPY